MAQMTHQAAQAHLEACGKRVGQDLAAAGAQGAHSFVLSNVFAGCPLKVPFALPCPTNNFPTNIIFFPPPFQVLCAASWKCTPAGGEPCLYIIVGAATGLYILETSGEKRELVQVSKRVCTWLYVMDEEGMMLSVSGRGLVCVHDLNSLIVGPTEVSSSTSTQQRRRRRKRKKKKRWRTRVSLDVKPLSVFFFVFVFVFVFFCFFFACLFVCRKSSSRRPS
jgi:hypothetical protein